MVKTLAKSQKHRRHPVDTFRVRYWYAGVERTLNCDSAYKVERRIEPDHFHYQHQRTTYPNKWRRSYVTGNNTPQSKLVHEVDLRVTGSARELNHPLWLILKQLDSGKIRIPICISNLDPAIQAIIMQPQNERFGSPRVWTPFTSRQERMLLKRGDLDALAALVLYWWDAKCRVQWKEVQDIATTIYHMLLLIGKLFRQRNLHAELLSLFTTSIFNQTPWSYGRFGVDTVTYELSLSLLHSDIDNSTMSASQWRSEVTRILKHLSGEKGFDVKFAMDPFCLPSWEYGPPSQTALIQWEEHRRLWAWGWDCLLQGINGIFPPQEAFFFNAPWDTDIMRKETLRVQINNKCWDPIPQQAAVMVYGQWPPSCE